MSKKRTLNDNLYYTSEARVKRMEQVIFSISIHRLSHAQTFKVSIS